MPRVRQTRSAAFIGGSAYLPGVTEIRRYAGVSCWDVCMCACARARACVCVFPVKAITLIADQAQNPRRDLEADLAGNGARHPTNQERDARERAARERAYVRPNRATMTAFNIRSIEGAAALFGRGRASYVSGHAVVRLIPPGKKSAMLPRGGSPSPRLSPPHPRLSPAFGARKLPSALVFINSSNARVTKNRDRRRTIELGRIFSEMIGRPAGRADDADSRLSRDL